MYHERLRDGDTSFGLTPTEYANREKARRREREKKRRQRSRHVTESALVSMLPARRGVEAFTTASGIKAYYETDKRILVHGLSHRVVATRVALPFISIQHRAAIDNGRDP